MFASNTYRQGRNLGTRQDRRRRAEVETVRVNHMPGVDGRLTLEYAHHSRLLWYSMGAGRKRMIALMTTSITGQYRKAELYALC